MEFSSLSLIISQKIAKNKMRVPDSVKLHFGSMMSYIEKYYDQISDKIPTEHFSAPKIHIKKSNQWTDMTNNTLMKGCKPINHRQIFELLRYALYFY